MATIFSQNDQRLSIWVKRIVIFKNCSDLTTAIFFSSDKSRDSTVNYLIVVLFYTKLHTFKDLIDGKGVSDLDKCFSIRSEEFEILLKIIYLQAKKPKCLLHIQNKNQERIYLRKFSVKFISKIFRLK